MFDLDELVNASSNASQIKSALEVINFDMNLVMNAVDDLKFALDANASDPSIESTLKVNLQRIEDCVGLLAVMNAQLHTAQDVLTNCLQQREG